MGVGLAHPGHARVQVRRPLGVHEHPRRLDGYQSQRRVGDDPGEAHAARGRPEQLGILVRATFHVLGRGDKPESFHVRADRPVLMVVLAVDIARDRAANGHVSRAGSHRYEKAPRHDDTQQRVEGAAGLHPDTAREMVQVHDPAEPGAVEDRPAGALGGVPVRAPEAPRQVVTGLREVRPHLLRALRIDDPGGRRPGPAPAGEELAVPSRAHE